MKRLTLFLCVVALCHYSSKAFSQCNVKANFRTSYSPSCPSTMVDFTNLTDTVGKTVVRFVWDFGDGTKDSIHWSGFQKIYTQDGSFNPQLIVEDNNGCVDTFVRQAGAVNANYAFNITKTPSQATCAGDGNIQFAMPARPRSYNWEWSFGDPSSGNDNKNNKSWTPTHKYAAPGIYNISLKIWEVGCNRDTTLCGFVAVKGPLAIINLPMHPNNCRRPEAVPVSYFEKLKYDQCYRKKMGITTFQYVTLDSVAPFIVVSAPVYCNAGIDTYSVATSTCGSNILHDTTFILHQSSSEYEFDSVLVKGTFQWNPVTDAIPSQPVFTNYSGTCFMNNMHDTDLFVPNCSGPNLVRFTNNSIKYRLYNAIDNVPPFSNYPDRCKIPTYPFASDSMEYLWSFGDGVQCTSTAANPDVNCAFSTEVQPWHLFQDSGCYAVTLTVFDPVTQCSSVTSVAIIQQAPMAGHDTIKYPGPMTWERQNQLQDFTGTKTYPFEGNKGMRLVGSPCLGIDYPQQIDLSGTAPGCGREWFAMVFDSAAQQTLNDSCVRQIYDPVNSTYTTVKEPYKEFSWISKASLESVGMKWSYNQPGCKTIGLIVKTGDCYDTAWYHNYKYFPDIDPGFELRDTSSGNLLTAFCPPQLIDLVPRNPVQKGISEFIIRIFNTTNPLGPPVNYLTDTFKKAQDTIYTICDTTQYTWDNNTNPPSKLYTSCFNYPELICDGAVSYQQSLPNLLNRPNVAITDTQLLLDLSDTLKVRIDDPGAYTISTRVESYHGCARAFSAAIFVGHINAFHVSDTVIAVGTTLQFRDSLFYWHKWDPINFPQGYDPKPYWDNPSGLRSWNLAPGAQYETLSWDLNGDKVIDATGKDPFFTYNTTGSYKVSLTSTDSLGCSITTSKTIHVVTPTCSLDLGADITICKGDTAVLTADSGFVSYTWSTSATNRSISVTNGGTYWVTAIDGNNCSASDTINVTIDNNCVWPGDANNDKVVNNLDLLPIGVHYGKTGPPRVAASNAWRPYQANNWADTLITGTNIKHADCNGSGTINGQDTIAVSLNYNLTHNKRGGSLKTSAAPELKVVFPEDTVKHGSIVNAELHFGSSSNDVMDFYGMAFTLDFQNPLIKTGTITIGYPDSWIKASGENLLTLDKLAPGREWEAAVVRIDQINKNGFGKIADITFELEDDSSFDYRKLTIPVSDVTIISNDEITLAYSSAADTLVVVGKLTGIKETDLTRNILNVYPNPFHTEIMIGYSLDQPAQVVLEVYGMDGKKVAELVNARQLGGKHQFVFKGESSGNYLVKLLVNEKLYTRNVVKVGK